MVSAEPLCIAMWSVLSLRALAPLSTPSAPARSRHEVAALAPYRLGLPRTLKVARHVVRSDHRRRGPTAEELRAAASKTVPDVIAPDLRVLFCGINPSLYTAAVGHHFARPGNRFWPTLYAAGFTHRLLAPSEEHQLLRDGYGITNLVARATATAAELTTGELVEGAVQLREKVCRFRPRVLAVLGITAYRAAFDHPGARLGPQLALIGATKLWALPNPSGLNAHYTLTALARLFRELRLAVPTAGARS